MKIVLTTLAVAGGVALAAIAVDKPSWVTDEEREFVRRRTTHIDFVPGTPESNAKRFFGIS
jgi:hypothetical protein